MAKYTEAYYDLTGNNINIMHVRRECATDSVAYERVYRGHLFCPCCHLVPLTLVHDDGILYFRGHPNAVHSDECSFGLEERIVKDITKLCGEDETQALAQRDLLFRLTFTSLQLDANRQPAINGVNENGVPVTYQHQAHPKRLPQCRLEELPHRIKSNRLPEGVCVYYGVANCQMMFDIPNEQYKDKEEKLNVLFLKERGTGTTLMALTLSKAIWEHMDSDTQNILTGSIEPVHIAFLALPKKFSTSLFIAPYTCYLRSSVYLVARAD